MRYIGDIHGRLPLEWEEKGPGVFWAQIPYGLFTILKRGPRKFVASRPAWPCNKTTTKRDLKSAKEWAEEQHQAALAEMTR